MQIFCQASGDQHQRKITFGGRFRAAWHFPVDRERFETRIREDARAPFHFSGRAPVTMCFTAPVFGFTAVWTRHRAVWN